MDGLGYISVKGFKSFRSIENLKLGPVTVLIGANGSGKSNFIELFSLLAAMREGRMTEYVITVGRANSLLHFGSRATCCLEVEVGLESAELAYKIELGPTTDDMLVIRNQFLKPGDRDNWGPIKSDGLEPSIRREVHWSPPVADRLTQLFDGHRVYRFFDTGFHSPMKKTPYLHDNQYLRTDASNIAAFLYLLRVRHQESYRSIVDTVRQVAPFFVDFDLEPDRLNPDQIRLRWKHVGSDDFFDVSALSDGTLRFIALATLFLQPTEYRAPIVIVDEPELGLHPHAISVLAALIQQASVETKVVAATQSSLLVDGFQPDEVLVAERVDGATELRRLESSRLAIWLEDYSLGQLWEKNLLGGRPRPE